MKILGFLFLLTTWVAAAETAAGIRWNAPSAWKTAPQRPMRAATYQVPAFDGQGEAGEVGVFFFGAGQGGSIDANVDRWVEQFADRLNVQKATKKTPNGFQVTTVEVSGTYLSSASPMSPEKVKKPGYRLLGAIVEAPGGNVFFKFTAPKGTVAANLAAFYGMINRITKE